MTNFRQIFRCLTTTTVFLLVVVECQAGIIVSVDGLLLDNERGARVRVLAEHDGVGDIPTLTSFAMQVQIERLNGPAGGQLIILDDGEAQRTRNNDSTHLFSGKAPLLFNASVLNNGQLIDVLDSIGFGDSASTLDSPRVLASFNIAEDPLNPLLGNEAFELNIIDSETGFFDGTFSSIPNSQIEFRSGLITAAAIPEPGSITLLGVGVVITWQRKRRRQC